MRGRRGRNRRGRFAGAIFVGGEEGGGRREDGEGRREDGEGRLREKGGWVLGEGKSWEKKLGGLRSLGEILGGGELWDT